MLNKNFLRKLIRDKILKQISTGVQNAKYFGIIVDSTLDIAHVDQLIYTWTWRIIRDLFFKVPSHNYGLPKNNESLFYYRSLLGLNFIISLYNFKYLIYYLSRVQITDRIEKQSN